MKQRIATLIAAGAIATVAVLGVGLGNVQAHNGGITAGCNGGLPTVSANLTNYNGTNLISIKNNGVEIGPGTFGSSYVATLSLGSPFIAHTVVYKVTAHEDPNNVNGFSPSGTIEVPACQTAPSTTVALTTTTSTVATTAPPTTAGPTTTTQIASDAPTTTSQVASDAPFLPTSTTTDAPQEAAESPAAPVLLPRTGNNSVAPIVILGLFLLFAGLTLWGLARRPRSLES
jgi:LPXTG-motif cell wall-anchored protein